MSNRRFKGTPRAAYNKKLQAEKLRRYVKLTSQFHDYSFPAAKLARAGKLTPAQKSAIVKKYRATKPLLADKPINRVEFVRVPSAYRRRKALQSGEIVRATNRGVFVSINRSQIEKTGLGRVAIRIREAGRVEITYGRRRVVTYGANRIAVGKNPGAAVRQAFRKSRANSLSLVLNGYEAGGQRDADIINAEFEKYVNTLLDRIQTEVDEQNTRLVAQGRPKKDYTAKDVVAFRFYYGEDEETQTLEEFERRVVPKLKAGRKRRK